VVAALDFAKRVTERAQKVLVGMDDGSVEVVRADCILLRTLIVQAHTAAAAGRV
jgi:hypothetical protein